MPRETYPLSLRVKISRIGKTSRQEMRLAAKPLDSAQRIYEFWLKAVARRSDYEPDKEHLVAIVLNIDLRPRAYHVVSVGTLTETSAHPREIFRAAIIAGGYAIALAHNHPSGNCTPSLADRHITKQVLEASQILHIPLVDHVIVGTAHGRKKPFFSFKEHGYQMGVDLIGSLLKPRR